MKKVLLLHLMDVLRFPVQIDGCAVWGCFHIYLLEEESFSVFTLNLSCTRRILLVLKPILVRYATYTSVMQKRETSSAQTLRMDFSVMQETTCVQKLNFQNEQYLLIHRFWILQWGRGSICGFKNS